MKKIPTLFERRFENPGGERLMGVDKMYEQYQQNRTKWMYKSLLRWRFFQAAHLNWQRNHAATPAYLKQLKKPLLPERWDGPKNGWCKNMVDIPQMLKQMVALKMMSPTMLEDFMQKCPTPDSELYFDEARMVVGWRVPPAADNKNNGTAVITKGETL